MLRDVSADNINLENQPTVICPFWYVLVYAEALRPTKWSDAGRLSQQVVQV